jgi:CheY-like chemotaxis protein
MPSGLPSICQERSRLLRQYADAASNYATSVREMAGFVRSGDEVRAGEARRISKMFLEAAEKFRLALYRHEADHTCDRMADLQTVFETTLELQPEPLPLHALKPQPGEIPISSARALRADRPGAILILENDLPIRNLLWRLLERRGYSSVQIQETENLADELKAHSAELLVIDVSTTKGIDTAIALARIHPNLKILALVARSPDGDAIPGRLQVLPKPFALDSFVDCVDRLLERSPAPESGEH